MRRAPSPRNGLDARAIGLALFLHAALLGALMLAARPPRFEPAAEEVIEVELLSPEQLPLSAAGPAPMAPAAVVPSPAPPEMPAPAPEAAAPAPAQPSDRMVEARQLMSANVLAHPRSREARESLTRLDRAERVEQICNLEAMSQIRAWNGAFEPDRVVAFALEDVHLSRAGLEANGAAFRSRRRWYRLRYRCEVTPGGTKVAGFRFSAGDAIPRELWASLGLPPVH